MALDSDLNWTFSLYKKKREIIQQFKGQKRLIIIGGSGVHYGIDALHIEQLLNMHVINAGLHGGLGLNAILECFKGEFSEGDTILLIPEYGIISGKGTGWLSPFFSVAVGRPGMGGYGFQQTVEEFLKGGTLNIYSFLKSWAKLFLGKKGRAYDTVDGRGDVLFFLHDMKAAPEKVSNEVSLYAMQRIIEFQKQIRQTGANFLIGLPWVLINENDQKSPETVKNYIVDLAKIAPVLYNDKTLNLSRDLDLFSDTGLHMNKKGRLIRSLELANQIEHELAKAQSHKNTQLNKIIQYVPINSWVAAHPND
jgi:hypothetical protein